MSARKKPKSYKKPFHVTSKNGIVAGKHFEAGRRLPTGCNRLIRMIIKRAKDVQGWTWPQMAYYLRMGKADSTIIYRAPGILKNADMSRIRYDRYQAICTLAGIPRAVATVIYAQACIPDAYADDRKAIGVLYKGLNTRHFQGSAEERETTYNIVKDAVRTSAKQVPDAQTQEGLDQIYSGMTFVPKARMELRTYKKV